jgi:hypothetical protein
MPNMFEGKKEKIISLKNAQSQNIHNNSNKLKNQLTTCTLPLGAALTAAEGPSPTTLSFSPDSPNTLLNSLQALR